MNLAETHELGRIDSARCRQSVFERGQSAEAFADHRVVYPRSVVEAMIHLYREYNEHFADLVSLNREWDEDYAYCCNGGQDTTNWIVQIDMAGLSARALGQLARLSVPDAVDVLRGRVFEIENSWAAYRTHAGALGVDSRYERMSSLMLDGLRERFGRPIALLAGSDEKYRSMLDSEFACAIDAPPSDECVRRLTGFDRFFAPDEFKAYLERRDGRCEYLLYVRASDAVETLRDDKRELACAATLFADERVRRIVKANALTFNIDDPAWEPGDPRRINDTKLYMPSMRMAHVIESEEDLAAMSAACGGGRLRIKPAQGAYGCYGHLSGRFSDKRFRYAVRCGLRKWRRYIGQVEQDPPVVINDADGRAYTYMDRVFCGIVQGEPSFFGGHRLHLETDNAEAKRRRLHIVDATVFAEIDAEIDIGG